MPWLRIPACRPAFRRSAALLIITAVLFAATPRFAPAAARVHRDAPSSPASLTGTVAYLVGGDVFTLAAGSRPARITGTGDVTSVHWSPGGTRLLITRDRQSFAIALDGSSIAVDGAWAPGDSVVAVATPDGGVDLLVPADGSRSRLIVPEDRLAYQPVAWSSDGGTLALTRQQLNAKGLPASESTWLVDRGGRNLRELVAAGANWPHPIEFSPDGNWLAVLEGPAQLCVSCRADGEQLVIVAVDGSRSFPMGSLLRPEWLTWMPDSSAVVASIGIGRETYRNKHLITLDLVRDTLSETAAEPGSVEIQPAFSPSGDTLAFTRGTSVEGPLFSNLDAQHGFPDVIGRRVVDLLPGAGTARALDGSTGWAEESPRWAGDQSLLVVRWRSTGPHSPPEGQLWLADAATGSATILVESLGMPATSFGYYGELGWSALFSWHP